MTIVTRMLDLEKDGVAGYLAYPEQSARAGAILVIHHNHGLSGELLIEAYEWAAQGYVVLVPALFAMVGFPGPSVPKMGQEIQKKTSDPKFLEALRKGWDYLAARPDVDPERVGVLSYCMGGRLGVHFVAATPEVRCFATYYPSIKDEPETDIRPVQSFKPVAKIACPTFVVFGGNDRMVPNDMQLRIWKQLVDNGISLEWHFYSSGTHGFAALPSEGYQPELARRVWPITAGFFQRELAAPVGAS